MGLSDLSGYKSPPPPIFITVSARPVAASEARRDFRPEADMGFLLGTLATRMSHGSNGQPQS
jgi:hypothetical protein